MMTNSLIDDTLKRINQGYSPRTLRWIKGNPDRWAVLLTLEGRVNEMALGSDTEGLKRALSDYQKLILAAVKEYKALKENKGQEMFNFVECPMPPETGERVIE
jgi:hypothetical protein